MRYFEADFLRTTDNKVVALHDGQEVQFGLPKPFSSEQFQKIKDTGKYQKLEFYEIGDLMAIYDDWYLITDIKDNNSGDLELMAAELQKRDIDFRTRIIPQIYFPEEILVAKKLGFKRMIFTMYRFGKEPDKVISIVKSEPEIFAVTMWAHWYNKDIGDKFHKYGKKVFVHTVNSEEESKELFGQDVDSIYTDFLH